MAENDQPGADAGESTAGTRGGAEARANESTVIPAKNPAKAKKAEIGPMREELEKRATAAGDQARTQDGKNG